MIGLLLKRYWYLFVIAVLAAFSVFMTRRNGALSNSVKTLGKVNDARKRMAEVTARTRTDRDSVRKRLHDGKF